MIPSQLNSPLNYIGIGIDPVSAKVFLISFSETYEKAEQSTRERIENIKELEDVVVTKVFHLRSEDFTANYLYWLRKNKIPESNIVILRKELAEFFRDLLMYYDGKKSMTELKSKFLQGNT